METYKELPLWKKASALGGEVDSLTRGFPEHNALIRLLRDKTAALPVTVSLSAMVRRTTPSTCSSSRFSSATCRMPTPYAFSI